MEVEREFKDEFEKQVWKEYIFYQASITIQNHEEELKQKREKSKNSIWSWFINLFTWLFFRFIRKGMKKEEDKRNHSEFIKEAPELIAEPEIKKAICQSISKLSCNEILTEGRFVRVLTAALLQPELVKKFVIPRNAVLYGIISYQLFQQGLENYCNEQNV